MRILTAVAGDRRNRPDDAFDRGDLGPAEERSSAGLETKTRERLIDAFTKVAAERGYLNTSVEDVVSAAGLPHGAFYEQFWNMRQCLTAAYDAYLERMIREAEEALTSDDDWSTRVRLAVAAGLGFVGETQSRSRLFAVEALRAGPAMVERHLAAIERIAPSLRRGRDHFPNARDLPDLLEPVLIAGVACVLGSRLLAEEERMTLEQLETELVEILLAPYLGAEEAKRVAA